MNDKEIKYSDKRNSTYIYIYIYTHICICICIFISKFKPINFAAFKELNVYRDGKSMKQKLYWRTVVDVGGIQKEWCEIKPNNHGTLHRGNTLCNSSAAQAMPLIPVMPLLLLSLVLCHHHPNDCTFSTKMGFN